MNDINIKLNTKKLTVSIGIPAYNEEANIRELILGLIKQKKTNFILKEILVFSDGSTDGTVKIVKMLAIKFPIIKLFRNKNRIGQQLVQNKMIRQYKSDLLMIVEGDVLPKNRNTIDEMVEPFLKHQSKSEKIKNLGMVVGNAEPTAPRTLFESIMMQGSKIKNKIFREWRRGDNIYSSGGHSSKILSRYFTENLTWPKNVPEDGFAYLKLKELNLTMIKKYSAGFIMRNVTNAKDRIRQCNKFISGQKSLKKYFNSEWVKKEYAPPFGLIFKATVGSFWKNPILTILYLIEVAVNRLVTMRALKFNPLYIPYKSSKTLIYEQSK